MPNEKFGLVVAGDREIFGAVVANVVVVVADVNVVVVVVADVVRAAAVAPSFHQCSFKLQQSKS